MTTPTHRLLTVAEAAKRLHLSNRAIIHRIHKGQIVAAKIGAGATNAYVITEEEVARAAQTDRQTEGGAA